MAAPRTVSTILRGLAGFALIWFGSLAIGFPLVVLALGYRLSEGWALIAANPKAFVLLSLFPYPIIAVGVGEQILSDWTAKKFASKSESGSAPPKE